MTIFAALARFLVLSALLVLGGSVTLYWLVLRRPATDDARGSATQKIARLACTLLLIGLLFSLSAQFLEFRDANAAMMPELRLLLRTGWGRVWLTQLVLALLSLVASVAAARVRAAWLVLTISAIALCASPSFSSHAMASERFHTLAVSADVVHIITGSVWIGGLMVLTLLIATEHARDPQESGRHALLLIRHFSPIALTAATVIVATGTIGVLLRLTAIHDLWSSGYGRLLTIKIALFLGVLAGGYYNWQRATPRLEQSGDARVTAQRDRFCRCAHSDHGNPGGDVAA